MAFSVKASVFLFWLVYLIFDTVSHYTVWTDSEPLVSACLEGLSFLPRISRPLILPESGSGIVRTRFQEDRSCTQVKGGTVGWRNWKLASALASSSWYPRRQDLSQQPALWQSWEWPSGILHLQNPPESDSPEQQCPGSQAASIHQVPGMLQRKC